MDTRFETFYTISDKKTLCRKVFTFTIFFLIFDDLIIYLFGSYAYDACCLSLLFSYNSTTLHINKYKILNSIKVSYANKSNKTQSKIAN